MLEREAHELKKAHRERRKSLIELRKEEVALRVGVVGLQKDRAERGRKRKRHEAREHDGDRDRHGKLSVEFARDPAQEGDGNEDGTQHEDDRDQGARDFLHRLLRGFVGAESFGAHDSLDVFQDHDGVVHDDADRKRHGKERERVEREVQEPEPRHRADERHRHGDDRNDGRAPALQKDEDDEKDEQARFGEGAVDLGERRLDEDRRVVGDEVCDLALRVV